MKQQAQHPLFNQFLGSLLSTAGKYFTQPTMQSPTPSVNFPTPFQQDLSGADKFMANQVKRIPLPQQLQQPSIVSTKNPMVIPTVTPTATPTQTPGVLTPEQIRAGLLKFNPNTPLATQSAVLSEGMNLLSKQGKIDPYLVILKALMESRGGLDLLHPTRQLGGAYEGVNNPYNFRDTTRPGKFVNYPDYKTAVLGGDNPYYGQKSQGFVNTILNAPQYKKYRETGNIDDFNSVFTPQSDNNPAPAVLGSQFNQLKSYFK